MFDLNVKKLRTVKFGLYIDIFYLNVVFKEVWGQIPLQALSLIFVKTLSEMKFCIRHLYQLPI